VGWVDYLKANTVKDLMKLGILSEEFKSSFVNGKSGETQAGTLYEVLLARTGDPGGLEYWGKEIELLGLENVVDRLLASLEYNNNFGDDAVPGGGREGCDSLTPPLDWQLVEQFYCRVLQRKPESDEAIASWADYLKSNTVKDLMRVGILTEEFKIKFVIGKEAESQANTLYDVLLARPADSGGLVTWSEEIRAKGWEYAVDQFLASAEYTVGFGNDAVPGGGREECF
jgi:hypothetical protein